MTTNDGVTPCPPPDSPPPLSPLLRDTSVLIVGAGPVGLFAAAMLTHRGARVTVIDRAPDPTYAALARSYTVGIMSRGHRATSACPGLPEYLQNYGRRMTGFHVVRMYANGSTSEMNMPSKPGVPPMLFMRRGDVVAAMLAYLEAECPSVTILPGTKLVDAAFNADGSIALSVRDSEGAHSTLQASLLLGCDGARSAVAQALRNHASSPSLSSTAGFDEESFEVFSSTRSVKTIALRLQIREFVAKAREQPKNPFTEETCFRLVSREPEGDFTVASMCVLPRAVKEYGGLMGLVSGPPESPVFALRDVDKAFQFFQDYLPQINVREYISEEAMRDFVEAGDGWPFSMVRRTKSLVALVGSEHGDSAKDNRGAVILLGDSLHSAPPDLGQGLNAGLEDVAALMSVFDGSDQNVGLARVAQAFERLREPDVDGLMYLNRCSAKGQIVLRKGLDVMLDQLGAVSRMILHKMMPRVFHPPMLMMAFSAISYGEMKRRAEETTRRIWMCVAGVVVGAGIGIGSMVMRRKGTTVWPVSNDGVVVGLRQIL